MKLEIDSESKLQSWLRAPEPAVFQGLPLAQHSEEIAAKPLAGCVFLGCDMGPPLKTAAAAANCFVVARREDLPFDAFRPSLYSPLELFNRFRQEGYRACLDWKIYESYIDPATKEERQVSVDEVLFRRIHDASIAEALDDLLDGPTRLRSVAIMGGHDMGRNKPTFKAVAALALELTKSGYMIVTGGGPGLMEAGNLGAYCAGFADPVTTLETALSALAAAPVYSDPNWLKVAYDSWERMGQPADAARSRSVGIPTWFYGHEPPNVFATDIAKYFENSVREEGLLGVALAGVIFAEGNAGTVQEIFQDACQNYYRTYAKKKSPMVLFGVDYWNPPADQMRHNPADKRKKVYPLLEKLAVEKGFSDYIIATDDPAEIVKFIKSHPPV
jgi:predicted Rossmann-fold nucleotide-binding protein